MSTITKEWLQKAISQHEAMRDEIPFGLDEDDSNTLAAMRIALASLEAEPAIHRWRRVTVEPYGPYPWHYGNVIGFSKPVEGIEDEYYYSAPPAPVSVPDEATPENIEILASTFAPRGVTYQWDKDECNAAADSWNACRAAMLQGVDGNCRTIETSAGYAIINVSHKPHPGDTVLISYCGRTEFAIVQGKALIVPEGEAIEGDALDDTTVHGVVTHFLNRVGRQDDEPIPVM